MDKTYLTLSARGGGNPYSAPELTVIAVRAEHGFAASGPAPENYDSDDMNPQPEEDW